MPADSTEEREPAREPTAERGDHVGALQHHMYVPYHSLVGAGRAGLAHPPLI